MAAATAEVQRYQDVGHLPSAPTCLAGRNRATQNLRYIVGTWSEKESASSLVVAQRFGLDLECQRTFMRPCRGRNSPSATTSPPAEQGSTRTVATGGAEAAAAAAAAVIIIFGPRSKRFIIYDNAERSDAATATAAPSQYITTVL